MLRTRTFSAHGHQYRRPKILARVADAATKSAEADFDQIERDLEEATAALLVQVEVVAAADAMRQLSFALSTHGESGEARLALVEEARRLLEREPLGASDGRGRSPLTDSSWRYASP
jgi:hypothetical protein